MHKETKACHAETWNLNLLKITQSRKGRHQLKKNVFFWALPECRGGGTVPQQGHNFDSSENDFFHLFSIFWDKIRTFLGNSRF